MLPDEYLKKDDITRESHENIIRNLGSTITEGQLPNNIFGSSKTNNFIHSAIEAKV